MFSKNNKKMIIQKEQEKINYYGIKKFNAGTASVLIAAGFVFLGGGSALASNDAPATTTNTETVNNNVTANKEEVSTITPVKANKTNLSEAIARVQEAIANARVTEKTASVIEDSKAELAKAQALEGSEVATQGEVDRETVALKNKAFVLESMKKATTKEADKPIEEKVNKNQDPRNGKAIPGKGESGFRADAYKLDDSNNAQLPDTATTGTDKFTFVALPENDTRRNSGAIALADGKAGDIVVYGTGAAPTDLEIEMYSSQRTGQVENPVAMSTVNGQPATSPGRMDYPLSKEQVQKLQEEAKLWVGKEKPDGNRVTTNLGAVYGSSGAYEFLATEIYKLGYEQGVDRVYIPNISNRFAVTEKAKEAGWKIKSIEPSNMPPGLIYDRESDSIQGRVVANLQNGVYDFRFDVAAENEKTHQIVRMKFQNLRSGWIGWQDTQPPKIEVSNDAYEVTVGQNVNIEVKYSDDAGSNFSGDKRRVKYTLKDGRVVEIGNQSYRQAVSGLAGYPTTKNQGTASTSIPGVNYDLSRDKTPTEKEANGDEKIFGKGILTGSPTKAGIYTVSVFAKDYNNKNKSDTTWIHSGHEVQKYMTVVVKPTVTIKNIHAYATNIPVTISDGASTAELTLPNGKVIKLEARNGNWTLADGGTVLGPVGGEINVPVSQEDTKDAAVDTIKVKAITENVKATLLRNEIELLGDDGQKHTARLSETTGHWELEDAYKVVKTPTADGGYKLTKRQVYTEVQADGSTNYYIYSYTRTFNADDKVVSVNEVTRPKTVVPRLNTENTEGATTIVEYDAVTKEWKSSDGSNVTATKEGDFWKVRTESGFTGLIKGSKAESLEDKGSILNDAPTATSTSYTAVKGATVDLVKQASAAVTITDREDDSTTSPKKETTVTKVTVTSPSGQQSEYTDLEQAKAHLLSEVGTYTVKVEVKDSNGNVVTANTDTETGTDKGAETAVNSTTYTITVKDQETKKLYKVEDDIVTNDELKGKVEPTTIDGFTPTKNDFTNIPTTVGKAGQTIPTPASVTYTKGTETIPVETKVDVVVLPKVEPTGVTVLKDSTNLEEAVKAKAVEAANAIATDKIPTGVTVSIKQVKDGTLPQTTTTGVQTPAKVIVEYKDENNNVVETREVDVPVTVVSSTPSKIVVFEGEKPTADQAKEAVTPGTDGTKGEPTTLPETAGKAGATDVKVDVPVTYDNGKLTETVSVPVTVLPKPEADEILVAKNSDKEKAKEKVLAKAKKAIEDATFKGKLPQGATVTVDETATITVPDLTEDTEVDVPVKYIVDGQEKTTTVKVPVTIVEGVPQIVPVKETNDVLPDPEKSIDKTDYPEGSTFRYKTPEGQTTPIDVTTPGDKDVIVEVLDKNGNPIAEVPATVRVVESYPKYVPVDPSKKQPDPKENINPNDFPTGTTFEYKDNTPVDTTTPGEKPVTVVAKLNGQPITEIPATIVVVESKTQYVPVNAENDKKPKPQDSITPDNYPEGSTFEYKTPEGQTTPYDGTTPGEKDVTVVVKDPDGDTIVEVPAKIKVVQGKEQLTPVNAEDKDKPKAEDSITPSDYPEGSTFEYKVPEGQTTPYDGTTPGDKPVTVVVKDKDGKVLVEVPANIKVVESKPTPIETPVTKTPLEKDDYTKGLNIPDGATVEVVGDLPDLTTPGEKTPVEVKITLKNGKSYTVKVPVNVTPVKEIETPVTTTPLTPEDYTKGITIPEGGKVTKVENIPDLTTPGKKDPVKVTVELPNGKVVTVDVPVNVTPITPIETPVTTAKLTPEDILKQIKVPEGATTKVENIPDLTTPGKKDPVKVTITLPNGKVVTVEIPVNVTPIEDIVKKQGDPITAEDVEKHIPKGVKVISIGDKPTTDVPGERPSIPVEIELPNGIRVTMNIPVIVTPKVTPVVVQVGTPVTPEDVQKHIELPNGWKVTKVGEIPTTTTPGTKPVVPVEIELPDGRKITVDVPVIVTPTVRQIVVPQGTPITPDDVKGHIDLPKEPGWEIIEVGEIPTTIPAGVKPSVKVKIKVPTGEIIEVEVPIIVTPTVTPIVVEVGTPITEDEVKKHVDLPEGWKITKVGEIPTTNTPGDKPSVTVELELPDGRKVTVDVPVKVTPKSNHVNNQGNNGSSATHIVTRYQDGDGKEISPEENGSHGPKTLEGYEYIGTKTDKNGNVIHTYKKVVTSTRSEQPVSPVRPTDPDKPVVNPTQVSRTESNQAVSATTVENDKKELPNTGTDDKNILSSLGLLGMLGAFGLVARKKKED